MQENVLEVARSLIADAVPNNITLKRDEETTNRTTYKVDGSHTLSSRDVVQFYRTYPKRSGNSRGSAKCAMKVTTDVSVPNADGSGNIVLPLIGEVTFSLPVGVSPTQTEELRQRLKGLLHDPSISGTLCDELNI